MTEKQIVSIINSCARPGMYFGSATPDTILAFYHGIDLMTDTSWFMNFLEFLENKNISGYGVKLKIKTASISLGVSWEKCFFDYFIEYIQEHIIEAETKEITKALTFYKVDAQIKK